MAGLQLIFFYFSVPPQISTAYCFYNQRKNNKCCFKILTLKSITVKITALKGTGVEKPHIALVALFTDDQTL